MEWLRYDYPKYDITTKPWKNGLFAAFLICLFFILFQPFGFRDKEFSLKLFLFPTYALLTFGYVFLHFYITKHVAFLKNKWTVKNEILSVLAGIFVFTLIIHIVTCSITGDMPFNFHWYFKLLYHTFSLMLILTSIEFLYYFNKVSAIKSEQLAIQNEIIAKRLEEKINENQKKIITFQLEKESIEINRERIILIQSTGNYLEFHLIIDNGTTKKLIKRGRMHQVEEDLEGFYEFFRCHRAFIVNLKYVNKVVGNSKNARMIFNCQLDEIPVSRNQYKQLKDNLEKLALN